MLQYLLMAPLVLFPSSSGPQPTLEEGPFVELSLEAALAQAEASEQLVFIDFYTEWCGPCKRMDRETWTDKMVIQWLEKNTVSIKVDADKNPELRDRYEVAGYPTLMFLDSGGYEKGRMLGFRGQREFLSESRTILQTIKVALDLQGQVKASPKDPRLKLQLAKLLREQSDFDQALDLLLWGYDFGGAENIEPLNESELVDALTHIKSISKFLGRAWEEMDVRWQIERLTVLGEKPTRRSVQKFLAIDTAFGFEVKTLKVFDELLERWPWELSKPKPLQAKEAGEEQGPADESLHGEGTRFDPRSMLFERVLPELVRRRRYPEVLDGFGDPQAWLQARSAEVQAELMRMDTLNPATGKKDPAELEAARQESLRPMKRRGGMLYQALLSTPGRDEAAAELAAGLLRLDPRVGTWKVLMRNARNAGRKDIQKELFAAGMEALPQADRSKLSSR